MDSSGLLRSLQRHARLVVIVTLAGLLIGGAAATLLPRTYTARATLFLRVQAASTSLYERSQFGLQRIQSYPELLDSPALLRSVIAKVGLHVTPQQLAARISADNPTSTVLLNVSAEAPTAQQAADIANVAADVLSANVNTLENNETTSKNAVMLVPQISAQAPARATLPNVPAILGLGLVAGLVAGLLAALALERYRPRIRTAADVRRVTGLPLVAQLPAARKASSTSAVEAAALTVAANLRTLGRGRIAPMLVLVPAGKVTERPTLRYAIANGIARTGRDVVVIETSPRTTGDHALDAGTVPGLAELVAGRVTADAVVVRSESGVDIVPAGDQSILPTSFELERRFEAAVRPLVASHDVAVLQTTVGDGGIDLTVAGPVARAAVIVASRRSSTERDVRRALASLRALDVMPIGVILTDGRAIDTVDLVTTWAESDFVRIAPDEVEQAPEIREVVRPLHGPRRIEAVVDDGAPGTVRGDR